MQTIGGQAVVEGVLMISDAKSAVSVRLTDGSIKTQVHKRRSFTQQFKHIFLLRGVLALIDMVYTGTKAITWSSNQQLEKEEQIGGMGIFLTILFSFALGIGIFIVLPLYVTKLITTDTLLFNILDGVIRVVVFILYILLIAQLKDVKRLFEYHGAEHMAVHCHEARKKLTPETVRTFSTLHPRCGTAFIFIVLLISIFVYSFITSEHWLIQFGLRLLFIPLIAGISYEILKLGAKHQDKLFFRALIAPGLWFQKITTKEPDKKQVEVAIASLKAVIT